MRETEREKETEGSVFFLVVEAFLIIPRTMENVMGNYEEGIYLSTCSVQMD